MPLTQPRKIRSLLLLLLGLATEARALAACQDEVRYYEGLITTYKNQAEKPGATEEEKDSAKRMLESYRESKATAERQCIEEKRLEEQKRAKADNAQRECAERIQKFKDAWQWDDSRKQCINKAEAKSLPTYDDCNSASVFSGALKGENCKKAAQTVKDVQSRNSALTDATTAATTAYSNVQAMNATGAQNDAQTRQANIMKTLAISKIATAALNLSGAAQLKSAASAAEQANSSISNAQKALRAECDKLGGDDEACFYQNAAKFGISPDQRSYANFERMIQAARQSQDQADAANAMAKNSLITGGADLLVGLQALKAAQMANNNVAKLAPPPMIVPPPVTSVRLGNTGTSGGTPNLAPAAQDGLGDAGKVAEGGSDFGNKSYGRIEGGMIPGKMGAPNIFKPATASGVSGGGGGGGGGSGFGARGGGGGQKANTARKGGTAVGEYAIGKGGGGGQGGSSGGEKPDAANPLGELLGKLFPPDANSRPVVDARQLASGVELGAPELGSEQGQEEGVTASDLSIFEQISAKYRQLDGSGRF